MQPVPQTSILESLIEEAYSREKQFREIEMKVRNLADVDTRNAGHTYEFSDGSGSKIEVHVTDKLDVTQINFDGRLPPQVSLFDVLPIFYGHCDLEYSGVGSGLELPIERLSEYGIGSSHVNLARMSLNRVKEEEKSKVRRKEAYDSLVALPDATEDGIRKVLRKYNLLKDSMLGVNRDELPKTIRGVLATMAKIKEFKGHEYADAALGKLEYSLQDMISKRSKPDGLQTSANRIELPHLVLDVQYNADNGTVKLDRGYLREKDNILMDVKDVALLSYAERKLVESAKRVEVNSFLFEKNDNRRREEIDFVKDGNGYKISYRLSSFGKLDFGDRETTRDFIKKVLPAFAYTNVRESSARYGGSHGRNMI